MKLLGMYVLAGVLLLMAGCQNSSHPGKMVFQQTKQYEAKELSYDKDKLILGFPSDMTYVDSALVVLNLKSTHDVTILDLKNNQITETGRSGKGPGELVLPSKISQSQGNPECFDVYDFMGRKLLEFPIDSCRRNGMETKPTHIRHTDMAAFRCCSMTGNRLLQVGLFSNQYAFMITGAQNDTLSQFGGYDFNPDDHNQPMNKAMAYQGNFCVRQNRLVWACSEAPIIQIYSIGKDGQPVLTKSMVNGFVQYQSVNKGISKSVALSRDNKAAYCDATATDKRIYLLYSGKSANEVKSTVMCSEVHVLDWNGHLLEKMMLNVGVYNIAVDDAGKRLYAIVHNPEPQIVYFPL